MNTPCCQRATQDELDEDVEGLFDCDVCPLRARIESLDPVNQETWTIHAALCGRAVQEWGLMPVLFDSLTEGWTADARVDVIARLDLMRTILAPPPPMNNG